MLFDEPTNAMDQITELRVLKNMQQNLKGRTAIFVTQKMTLLNIVDRVMVIDHGKLVIDAPKEQALKQLQGKK